MRTLVALAVTTALILPQAVLAQQDDRGFLTTFLEDNLSDAGRDVTITGFAGALSSRATIAEMTIADATGVWITLRGVTLDWSRSALLSGRVEVDTLTADEIIIARLPDTDPGTLPEPEARGFSLPDLPVSVQIGQLAATRIELGPTVLGQPVEGRLDASLSLVDGAGTAKLDLLRTDDGPDGEITLDASYSNATRELVLDLSATEEAGGIFSTALNLPGAPSVALTVAGTGPIDNVTTRIALATEGVERVAGTVTLSGTEAGGLRFTADIAGNFVPLFAPEQAAFFGDNATLTASGTRAASGLLSLDSLKLSTDALQLDGALALSADGQPLRFDLTGMLGRPDGAPVVLPFSGADQTSVTSGTLALGFDAEEGEGWTLDTQLLGLTRNAMSIDALTLTGSGQIAREASGAVIDATFRYGAQGVTPRDAGIAQALGTDVSGEIVTRFQEGAPGLQVSRLTLDGNGYGLTASGEVGSLATGLEVTGTATAEVADLGRLSILTGRPLQGTARILATGTGSPLGGTFDLVADIEGQRLGIGQAQVDRVLAEGATVALSVKRDETGVALRQLDVTTTRVTGRASGVLSSTASNISARVEVSDLAVIGPGFGGTAALDATLTGALADGGIAVTGTGTDLRVGQLQADRLLQGTSSLTATLALRDEVLTLERAEISNPQLTADATGTVAGAARQFDVEARLANLAVILPEFPGAVTVAGTVTDQGAGYGVDLSGTGPAQIDAKVVGVVSKTGAASDLAITGTAQSALANPFIAPRAIGGPVSFDLVLSGPLRLSSLSGQVALSGARFSDVERGVSLRDLEATAALSGGRANVSGRAALAAGGTVAARGTIGLAAPFDADIAVDLTRARLRNPDLFTANLTGGLRIAGPVLGGALVSGQVTVEEAEIRIPSGNLASVGAIPDIRHVADSARVRETRRRAGLLGDAGAGRGSAGGGRAGGVYALDIEVDAPSQIFIRGRGLDAELSGRLRLGGTTAAVVPSGGFSLIRGRLDILGKRLVLSEATLQVQGDFDPYVEIMASNASDGVTSSVRIEGPARDPEVTFTSTPELPQEEVLARLLFGRGLQNISAFQAAQLANAVATLAGRGGEGIVGRLRRNFGLDDFDVATDGEGSTVLRAGKYLNENVYTEVEVDDKGTSEINLNLDVRPGVTVKGRVGADGATGLGIFLERDY